MQLFCCPYIGVTILFDLPTFAVPASVWSNFFAVRTRNFFAVHTTLFVCLLQGVPGWAVPVLWSYPESPLEPFERNRMLIDTPL